MVRKKFDRTVVKRCPQCEEHVPVACKFCTCGHPFATRNKILLKEEAEEAMGLLDGSTSDTKVDDNSSSENRRRPRRLTRERPNYYVITTELNRHVKKKARQRERNRAGASGPDSNNIPKKKKRGRPRGSVSSTSSATRTRSKTKKLSDHYPNSQPSHGLQIKKEELCFTDTKSSISSSLSYGCDKPLANVTVSICAAPNSCCTPNLSNCNVTKHHIGIQGSSSNYSSSSDSANSNSGSHNKDITINQTSTSINGHLNSNTMTNNSIHIKNQVRREFNSNSLNNNNSSNNNSIYYNNNNNSNNQKDPGGEKDMYASMSFEKAMKFYAILADLNRKIISQSFKPL